jgi:hypothetical protein
VKHSAKLFTALAALALFAVVMVGIQDRGADAQSADGTTGRVYLTNLNSCLTTQPNPPSSLDCGGSGRVFVGSGTSLFTTVVEKESEAPHDVLNSIARDSDVLIVTVMDSDANISKTGSLDKTVNFGPADRTVIPVPAHEQPITSSIGEVKLLKADGTVEANAIVSQVQPGFIVTIGTTQDADSSGLVTVEWQYSGVNTLPVEVYSLTDTADYRVALALEETGPSTGVFEGEIKLTANVVINGDDSPGSPGDASADPPVQAQLKVNSTSRVTVKYSDALDSSGNVDKTAVTDIAQVETTPPQAVVSEPANGLNTQVRQQAFRGNVTDNRSGIDVSSIMLFIDQGDDPDNNTQVVTGGVGDGGYSIAGTADAYSPALADNPGDGETSLAWSVAEPGNLPTAVTAVQPDHKVDFIVVAQDLAGNIGFSDADTTTSGVGVVVDNPGTKDTDEATNEPHVITIDQQRPKLTSAETGVAPDGDDDGTDPDLNNSRSIAIHFDDSVEGVEPSDIQITLEDDTSLIPVGVLVDGSTVYAELDADIPTDDKPTVRLQGGVSDPAGNTTSAGSVKATDRLAPNLTVELSGGSGAGTGANGPSALTKNEIIVTISSDEILSGLPKVQVYVKDGDDADDDPDLRTSLSVIAQGNETWTARATRSRLGADGTMSLVVSGTDISGENQRAVGKADPSKATAGETKFTLDSTKPELMTGNSSTSQGRPSIRIEFNEVVTVTSASVGDTVLVDDDTNLLASSDNKLFFYVPSEDLELGSLTVKASASDNAGNAVKDASYTLTVEERKAFDLGLFFGWNAVSVPSNPVDPDINAVFTNDSLAQVVAYDATDPESPWRIASRDPVSGAWTSTTDTPLRTIMAGPGYWVHSNSFDDQEIGLAGPIEPGSGQAPRVEAIPTGAGWNFIGVIDTTRDNTQGSSGASLVRADGTAITADRYFASVDARRAFRYNSALQSFTEIALDGSATVKIGDGIWVFINPLADGSTPAIAP